MHSWRICIIPQMLRLIRRTWKLPDTTLSMMRSMMNNGSRKLHRQRRNRRATWAGNYWQGLFLEVPHHLLRYRGLFRYKERPKRGITLAQQGQSEGVYLHDAFRQLDALGREKLPEPEKTRNENLERVKSGLLAVLVY